MPLHFQVTVPTSGHAQLMSQASAGANQFPSLNVKKTYLNQTRSMTKMRQMKNLKIFA
jgi:hypothetical protein